MRPFATHWNRPASSSSARTAGARGCTANRVQEFTVGFWQDIYKGDLGRARVGVQYEYVQLNLFSGATAIPGMAASTVNTGLNPNNNIVFFSLRYYPFN